MSKRLLSLSWPLTAIDSREQYLNAYLQLMYDCALTYPHLANAQRHSVCQIRQVLSDYRLQKIR